MGKVDLIQKHTFWLEPVPPFRLDLTVWTLRRRPDNIVDRWDGHNYRRLLALVDQPVEVTVAQVGTPKHPRLRVTIRGAELNAAMQKTITTALNRLLGLQLDLAPFYRFARNYPSLHDLARQFRGMKPPRFTSAFEGIINAIACQQLTLTVGIRLLNQIAATYGATMRVDGTTVHAFPQPRELASTSPTGLRKIGLSRHKSRAMIELAQSVVAGRLDPETIANLPDQEALERLQNVRGVGRWTAQYVLLRGLGRTHLFPGDDVGARNNLRAWLNLAEPLDYAGVQRTLEPWKGYGGLIYFHLLLGRLAQASHIRPNGGP